MTSSIKAYRRIAAISVATTLVLIAGCVTVGPDYRRPELKTPDAWTQAIAGSVDTADQPGLQRWWSLFDDPVLEDLIQRARQSNLDLQIAVSRVVEARARLGIANSAQRPDVNLGGGASKTLPSDGGVLAQVAPPGGFDSQGLYEAGFDASWELDIFGGIRRRMEAAGANYEATVDDQHDVLVTLLAEVALNYIAIRSAQQRLLYARANVVAQERSMILAGDRYHSGLSSKLDVVQARSNLANTRAFVPLLEIRRRQALNRLAVLLGMHSGSLNNELAAAGAIPSPADDKLIGTGVPADVLRQRPDIRAAERRLAAQTALIGVATAELYPRFGLTGTIGLQSQTGGDLFSASSKTWSLGLPFEWNVFSGGRIRSTIEVREESAKQAGLQYQQVVLLALEEVENAAVGFNQQQNRYRNLQDAAAAAEEAVQLVMVQYNTGLTNFNNVLTTQRSLFDQQDVLVVANAEVALELVSLYKALGGGWVPVVTP